ncbi:MAG TPA: aryl-sulfate sulfotransferase [Acidobacteriaceae bacterium]|nr:aryl-sulfate sulfotransferase [Acidobacteriaceae bacterium]
MGSTTGTGSPTVTPVAATTLVLSTTSFNFGNTVVTTVSTKTVATVTNSGSYPATLNLVMSGNSAFSVVAAQSCGTQLASMASCNIVVAYAPTVVSTPATQTASLNLNPGGVQPGTSLAINFSGISTPATTTLTLSSSSFNFGDALVGAVQTQTVAKVTNSGNFPATLNLAVTGNAAFTVVTNQSCGAQLAAMVSCNIVVSYAPTTSSIPATQTAVVNLNPGNVQPGAPSAVNLSGISAVLAPGVVTATNNPQVAQYTITPPFAGNVTISFGQTTAYGLQTFTLPTPVGGGPVSIYVAGMLGNTTYHMQATIQFSNGITGTDIDHTFTTGSYLPSQIPNIVATTSPGMTPQPGIEMLNPVESTSENLVATDLSGHVIWAYIPPAPIAPATAWPIKQLANGDYIALISTVVGAPSVGELNLIREFDLAGNTVKEISMTDLNAKLATFSPGLSLGVFNHDITVLPNGHWLVLAGTQKSVILTGDTTPTTVDGDVVVDLDTNLDPVWVWNGFDHLDVNRHPWMFPDWTHANAILYSKDDGNLLISLRHQNWVIKVDYNNGAGDGHVIWHLGAPLPGETPDFTLKGGTSPVDWQYAQHGPSFTTTNTTGIFGLVLMDNGDDRMFSSTSSPATCGAVGAPCYSTIPVFQINETTMTATLIFHQKLAANLYNFFGGNAQMLANGNIEYDLCGLSPESSQIFEVTNSSTPQTVWNLKLPSSYMYRGFRLPSLYPGVQW